MVRYAPLSGGRCGHDFIVVFFSVPLAPGRYPCGYYLPHQHTEFCADARGFAKVHEGAFTSVFWCPWCVNNQCAGYARGLGPANATLWLLGITHIANDGGHLRICLGLRLLVSRPGSEYCCMLGYPNDTLAVITST